MSKKKLRSYFSPISRIMLLSLLFLLPIFVVIPQPAQAVTACSVNYDIVNQWGNGFQANVTITNNMTTAVSGWNLTWTFGPGQAFSSGWNATFAPSGSNMSASNVAGHWNGTIAANGGTVAFGFQGTHAGSVTVPTNFAVNGVSCLDTVVPTAVPTVVPTTVPTIAPTPSTPTNILQNGNFAADVANWSCDFSGGAVVGCAVDAGIYHVNITNGGTATWNVQPTQGGIALTQGKTYTFAFDARADANRTALIKVERAVTPYEDFSQIGTGQALTTQMKRFKYTFTAPVTLANARVVMNVGNSVADVYVDNFWLVEGTADPCNGIVGCSASPTDSDNDGVADSVDQCVNTPAGEAVNSNGCSASQLDSDNDGVNDANDQCPNTPAGNVVDSVGCTVVTVTEMPIQAEDYDRFFDTTAGNAGDGPHPDDVDTQATTDVNGGYNVGWVAAGEWLEYDVNIPAGIYQVVVRVASDAGGGDFDLTVGSQMLNGTFVATGGWQAWKDLSLGNVTLGTAANEIRIDMNADDFNINWIDFQEPCDDSSCLDSDGDGVVDANDQCPNTPVGTAVNATGCEIVGGGITAATAHAAMGRGFNLGNVYDNGQKNVSVAGMTAKIDAYYAAGFRHVRIPVTWVDPIFGYTLANANGTLKNTARLNDITAVIDHALAKPGMYVILNAHHEETIKAGNQASVLATLWDEITTLYADRDYHLIFEILNEPVGMTAGNARNIQVAAYNAIRAVDQQRIAVVTGTGYSTAGDLAATWYNVDPVGGGNDDYLMATVHAYTPWDFAGQDNNGYGEQYETVYAEKMYSPMDSTVDWQNGAGKGTPVYLGEWGVAWGSSLGTMTCDNVRNYYQEYDGYAGDRGLTTTIWDDGGWFKIWDYDTSAWNNNLYDCIDGTCTWNDGDRFNACGE